MPTAYVDAETFRHKDFTLEKLAGKEYADCEFTGCGFSGSDLSGIRFLDCRFTDCDLSNAGLSGTSLQDVHFTNCKLLGLAFETGDRLGFAVSFKGCQLAHTSFLRMKLTRCSFLECRLAAADFTEADIGGIRVTDCDLSGATFDRTNLQKADLRGSVNYRIDPTMNRVKGGRFSLPEVIGLLQTFGVIVE